MKKAIAILSMIFAVALMALSIIAFTKTSSSYYGIYVPHEKYGGDAYTGIQNAAADTARAAAETAERVGELNNTVSTIGGGILMSMSFAFFLASLYFFRPEGGDLMAPNRAAPITAAPSQQPKRVASPMAPPTSADGWKCTCGNMNPPIYVTCPSCGKSAREIREQIRTEKEIAARSLAEDRIVAAGVCPDCNGTLEKSDVLDVMMCPDCGRMFG